VLVPSRTFQFVSKAGSYDFGCSPQGQTFGLAQKYEIKLERSTRDKDSSFLKALVSYDSKSF